jgi:ABC-type transport system involved in cytochrome c biogenesis permease subunit
MKLRSLFTWLPGLLAVALALATLLPGGKPRGFDTAGFGRLPVLQGGRIKPLDSVARNALLMIRGKQSLPWEGRTVEADEWLLDVLFRPQVADRQPVFVINDPDVLGLLGLQQSTNRYYSFAAIIPSIAQIEQQAQTAMELEAPRRSRFQNALLDLYQRLVVYHQLENSLQPSDATLQAEIQAVNAPEAAAHRQQLAQMAYFRPFAPPAGAAPDAWLTAGEALEGLAKGQAHPALDLFAKAGTAYAAGDPGGFNAAAGALLELAGTQRPEALSRAANEQRFNRAEPFYAGMVIYLLALLVLFASWAWKPEYLQPAAYSLLVAGTFVHTAGLLSRILLQGRPPVTNLYSSAIFVGWVAALLGAVLERLHRRGFGTAVAATAGFASLIVAHHLSGDGDTMEMMRAVLDSNFWLATHVVTITIGYGAAFLAGTIAIAYTLRKHLAVHPQEATGQALADTVYGVLCFALLFSFVGTVLGGIWADQSWGRFWGWDPKENGALLIVLWNALVLHARWGGYAKERGVMAMAIVGNVITAMAWFGVNLLNVGLHSYGFTDRGLMALVAFTLSQFALVALCLLPRRFWSAGARQG